MSLSGLALHGMLHAETEPEQRVSFDMEPRVPSRPAKANAVIQLFQNGGPSQMDLFDPKPTLSKYAGISWYTVSLFAHS